MDGARDGGAGVPGAAAAAAGDAGAAGGASCAKATPAKRVSAAEEASSAVIRWFIFFPYYCASAPRVFEPPNRADPEQSPGGAFLRRCALCTQSRHTKPKAHPGFALLRSAERVE